jgi:hypothetical protein
MDSPCSQKCSPSSKILSIVNFVCEPNRSLCINGYCRRMHFPVGINLAIEQNIHAI